MMRLNDSGVCIGNFEKSFVQGCLRWQDQQSQAVHHHVFPGVDHLGMLRQEEPAEMVHSVINTLNKELQRYDQSSLIMVTM